MRNNYLKLYVDTFVNIDFNLINIMCLSSLLWSQLEKKQAEVQQLHDEIQKMETNMQTLVEDLDSGNMKV